MSRSSTSTGYLYVLAGACLWATTGSFAKVLFAQELSFLQVAFVRSLITVIILLAFLSSRKEYFRVAARDLPLLALVGLMGVGIFAVFYFYTIQKTTIIQAVFLLYTSTIFATLLARLLLKEPLVKVKLVALASSVTGLVLLTRVYSPGNIAMPLVAILTGLGAALSYALFTITGKMALAKHPAWTVQFYSFIFGFFFLSFIANPSSDLLSLRPVSWFTLVMMSLVSTFAAFAFFYAGLKRVEASRASIVATIEPVVASFLGFALFAERLGVPETVGSVLILLGALLARF